MYGVVAPVRYSPLYSICSYQPIMHWKVELIRTSSSSEDFPDKPSNTHVICCSSDTLHPKSAKFTATAVDLCIAIEKLNQ